MTRNEWTQHILERQSVLTADAGRKVNCPWEFAHQPFHIIDNIYFVGTQYVSSYLMDTGSGLILIDAGFYQTAFEVINNIYKLGFDPKNIRKLLLTHAHFDHCGAARAIQELSGCEIYLGQGDLFFLTERRDLICCEKDVPQFTVDHTYRDDEPIILGNTVIRTASCPGHTPGTTSFFYTLRHNGREYIGATHGGIGINGLSRMELEKNGLPLDTQQQYVASMCAMLERHVDICLPSHNKHSPYFLETADRDCRPENFIDASRWPEMIQTMLAQVEDLIASGA